MPRALGSQAMPWTAAAVVLTALALLTLHAWRVDAAPGDADATFVPTPGCRLTDTRPPPDQVGPRSTPLGADEVLDVIVHGENGNCTGSLAIPAAAVAVALNVTAVNATTASNIRVYPGDLGNVPLLSNLNVTAGAPPAPNKVDVKLSPDGRLKVYNYRGSVDVVLDVVGYYTDASLRELATGIGRPPATPGPMTFSHGPGPAVAATANTGTGLEHYTDRVRVTTNSSTPGFFQLPLHGPVSSDGTAYSLSSVEYCLSDISDGLTIAAVFVAAGGNVIHSDLTDRTTSGCFVVDVSDVQTRVGHQVTWRVEADDAIGRLADFVSVSSTWTPLP